MRTIPAARWPNCLAPESSRRVAAAMASNDSPRQAGLALAAQADRQLLRWAPEHWRVAPDWQPVLAAFLASPAGLGLASFVRGRLASGAVIYPPQPLRALELTPLHRVRAVILGQDPYHGPGQAHGLAFSVPSGVRVPPSLANIYKELAADLGVPRPLKGNLESWARQGVLLLNTALTVEAGRAGSHAKAGWEPLTDAIIAAIAARAEPSVFLLWGAHARRKVEQVAGLGPGTHHLVLTAAHPSPPSAHAGFLGCRQFSQANAFLEANGRGAIDWALF